MGFSGQQEIVNIKRVLELKRRTWVGPFFLSDENKFLNNESKDLKFESRMAVNLYQSSIKSSSSST